MQLTLGRFVGMNDLLDPFLDKGIDLFGTLKGQIFKALGKFFDFLLFNSGDFIDEKAVDLAVF
jgi:hypothetical protein